MIIRILTVVCVSFVLEGAGLAAAEQLHEHTPYAGQHVRTIKSLSKVDIEALRAGRGWGFAKPAELNGYPGPLHVLELADRLALTNTQRLRVQAIFDRMKRSAIALGAQYLHAERALDAAFANNVASPEHILELTLKVGMARSRLQAVHLQAHLETTPLLTRHQRMTYSVLRGYLVRGHSQDRGHD